MGTRVCGGARKVEDILGGRAPLSVGPEMDVAVFRDGWKSCPPDLLYAFVNLTSASSFPVAAPESIDFAASGIASCK